MLSNLFHVRQQPQAKQLVATFLQQNRELQQMQDCVMHLCKSVIKIQMAMKQSVKSLKFRRMVT